MIERAKGKPPIEAEELRQKKRSKRKPFAVKYDDKWTPKGKTFTITNRYATLMAAQRAMKDMQRNNSYISFGLKDTRFNWRIVEEK